MRASTCVVDPLVVGVGAQIDTIPFRLARYKFCLGLNKRFSAGDPELASLAGSLGRRLDAGPVADFRQRDGDQQYCWQLSFSRLFTRPADQPRHAAVHVEHPVDPSSPPYCVDGVCIFAPPRISTQIYYSRLRVTGQVGYSGNCLRLMTDSGVMGGAAARLGDVACQP